MPLSLELRDECAMLLASFEMGDFIGIGFLMNREGVSNGCVSESSEFDVSFPGWG
jgi:hypothetical protein